jgi:DNA polymerase III subunit epsilon
MLQDYDRIIYFDTETTGLNHTINHITEIGWRIVHRNGTIEDFDAFINLEDNEPYDKKSEEITGITREYLKTHGSPRKEVITKFWSMLFAPEKTLLCAYNASFDMSFLIYEFIRLGLPFHHKIDILDTYTAYMDVAPYPHKLRDALEFFKITTAENSHNALDDVKALHEVTKELYKIKNDLHKYINIMVYKNKFEGVDIPWVTFLPSGVKNKIPIYKAMEWINKK